MSIKINKCTSSHNCGSRNGSKIKFLCIHYTASTNSKKGTAKASCQMFAKSSRAASADYVVDDEEIWQYNPNYKLYRCYSVGGSKYTGKTTKLAARYYGVCTNTNSVSIEIKSSKIDKANVSSAMDKDWYFTDKALKNAAKLAAYLLKKHGLKINKMIMHHEATGKVCPAPFCRCDDDLKEWYKFVDMVDKYMHPVKALVKTAVDKVVYKNPYKKPSGVFKVGSKGDGVGYIQYSLKNKYGYNIVVDEQYGQKTKNAVIKLQKAKNKKVDGIVGPDTLKVL